MMSLLRDWGLYAVVILAAALAVLVTNRPGNPRILRILARNLFLLVLFLFAYQLFAVTFFVKVPAVAKVTTPVSAAGDSVVGGPSLSAVFINQVLADAHSPAAGKGQSLYDLSIQYHIDDAYALATFQHESTYGKYGAAFIDHSLGNINCAGYPTCDGRFRWYATWEEGFEDFFRLIAREYIAQGRTTLSSIIPVYAPSSENDTGEYIQTLRSAIHAFRRGQIV
ncbi:glucosaminidase domain-containing protein [Dictyobacter kobayashii]|uniref:Uncharacterized protein n=1 Tax=Dictyobacter kobayashii TaxID=2014872 RepID=A0A402ADV0_9CHLR|nr:glucosaminidase domain-containing protein [Dictyobacter kobayashii]GCE17289.1 hypothetical protein KDK_10890 [Dictyobacter kobayashii]